MPTIGQRSPMEIDLDEITADMADFHAEFNLDTEGLDTNLPGHESESNMVFRQEPRTVKQEGAGISLDRENRREMVKMLDDHQCSLTVALHQYNKHHWLTEGAESFLSLHHLLEEHRDITEDHIDMVGERVARLGGVPTAHPETQHQLSYIKHEIEGRYTMRDFLRNDLEHELKIQQMLRKTIERANEINDHGTTEVLKEVLKDREDFGYHLYSVLEDDTLTRGMQHLLHEEGNINQARKDTPDDDLQ